MSHTLEPWKFIGEDDGDFVVWGNEETVVADEKFIGNVGDHFKQIGVIKNLDRINARRIVACVNACAGAETDKLEQVGAFVIAARQAASGSAIIDLGKRVMDAEAKVDELLTVLKYLREFCAEVWDSGDGMTSDSTIFDDTVTGKMTADVIAKCEVKS